MVKKKPYQFAHIHEDMEGSEAPLYLILDVQDIYLGIHILVLKI